MNTLSFHVLRLRCVLIVDVVVFVDYTLPIDECDRE